MTKNTYIQTSLRDKEKKMQDIKRIDLKRHVSLHKQEYMEAIEKVLDETAFSGGPYVKKFDQEFAEYCNVKYASGVDNGTSALHCAMAALGVGPGDEVIVPAHTFIATAWGPTYTGATPVFADVTPDTWLLDAKSVKEKITPKTKAIIGVHLYGEPFDYDAVKAVAGDIPIVEDCAQAHGAIYKGTKVGGLGALGCFSFYPGKNLYCFGEGGSVTTNNKEYIDYVNVMKEHGSSVRYYHDMIGYNMRMDGIQGAVLSVELNYLDQWTKRRQEIGQRYLREITNPLIRMQAQKEGAESVFHLFVVTVPEREKFIEHMESNGIYCDQHYPVPCHLQKAYEYLGYKKGDCPNAEYVAEHCCSLPMYPELRDDEVERVIAACNSFVC